MIPIYSTADIRAAEAAFARAEGGLSLLMERAGRALAARALALGHGGAVCVICGPGSNGGDGYAAAAELTGEGLCVYCYAAAACSGIAAGHRARFEGLGGIVRPSEELACLPADAAVVIDALFGTGLTRPPQGEFARLIGLINQSGLPVVCADLPSGLCADGGVFDPCVQATETVSFIGRKAAHHLEDSYALCGSLVDEPLGVHKKYLPDATLFAVSGQDAQAAVPVRRPLSHKGDYGKVLIVAGAEGYAGAAILAARAALRSGAGLVFLGVPRAIYPICAAAVCEAVTFPLPDEGGALCERALPELLRRAEGCDVCLCGCGLSRSPGARAVVYGLLTEAKCPLILDADGINALHGHIDVLKKAAHTPLLTPHMGELGRLIGQAPVRKGETAVTAARRIAAELGVGLVMKGHRTVCAFPDGRAYLNTTGNAGMARGGSGDVLAGMLAALCATAQTAERVTAAVYLHGLSGDLAAARYGMTAMLPTDMIGELAQAFRMHTGGQKDENAAQPCGDPGADRAALQRVHGGS